MSVPVRLQLSRRKGFDLQALSRATNGRPAVVVARPSRWGNPFDFRTSSFCWLALAFGCRGDRAGRQEAAVKAFRAWIAPDDGARVVRLELQIVMQGDGRTVPLGGKMEAGAAPAIEEVRAALAGKNLACWCRPGSPCHADVLLELANGPGPRCDEGETP